MKKLLILFISLLMTTMSFAQVTLSQAQLDSLPPSVQMEIKASVAKAEVERQTEAVSKYVGLGKEVGEAVNGALGAVEDHVLSIAESDLGHTAIFIVCWKLLYKDITGIVIGILLLLGLAFWIISDTKYIRNFESSFSKLDKGTQSDFIITHVACWFILFLVSLICIFA